MASPSLSWPIVVSLITSGILGWTRLCCNHKLCICLPYSAFITTAQCIKNVLTPLQSILVTSVSVVLPRLSVYRPPDASSPMNLVSPPDLGCMITALPRLATAGQALLQSVLAISYCLCQAIISHLCPNSAQKSESRVFT